MLHKDYECKGSVAKKRKEKSMVVSLMGLCTVMN
jgi:hypothetical protein